MVLWELWTVAPKLPLKFTAWVLEFFSRRRLQKTLHAGHQWKHKPNVTIQQYVSSAFGFHVLVLNRNMMMDETFFFSVVRQKKQNILLAAASTAIYTHPPQIPAMLKHLLKRF